MVMGLRISIIKTAPRIKANISEEVVRGEERAT